MLQKKVLEEMHDDRFLRIKLHRHIESMSSLFLKLHLLWLLKLEIYVVKKIVITINCYADVC